MDITFDQVQSQASAVLYVDLRAIKENYKKICAHLGSKTLCAAVVKSDAYGLGVAPIVKALHLAGCRHFFCSYLDDALKIRQEFANSDVVVYVLNGVFPKTEHLFHENAITPCLISKDHVDRWVAYGKKISQKLPCIIHVDTGMGREGLAVEEFMMLYDLEKEKLEALDIHFLMSHLANSNTPNNRKNIIQLDRFQLLLSRMPNLKATLANSSGLALGPQYHFDMVRPGMALYGYKGLNYADLYLSPTLSVQGRVLLTRSLTGGESIGYNSTFTCQRDTKVALISVGHGDGVLRAISNRGGILINGHMTPLIGAVSMDTMMVDITSHPTGTVHADMWVELYGDIESVNRFAESEGTSVYELMVRHGQRFQRIYKD
jgi:alanine racemase